MKFLNGIWAVLNIRIFLLALIVGGFLFSFQKCSQIDELNRQQTIHEQNIAALGDSLLFEKDKINNLLISINGYISSVEDLETLNTDLYNEVENQKGKVLSLNTAVIQLNQDKEDLEQYIDSIETSFPEVTKLNDSVYIIPWTLSYKYDTLGINFDKFQGMTKISITNSKLNIKKLYVENLGTSIWNRTSQIKLSFGQKIENDMLRVFVSSSYPGFTATSLEGVLIDPNDNPYIRDLMKKRHWFTGWSIGIGTSVGYDFFRSQPAWVIGPTFSFTIYQY